MRRDATYERVVGPAVAGRWYPAAAEQLRAEVDRLLEAQTDRDDHGAPGSEPHAIVAPHAGFPFSGAVAASAFCALRQPRTRPIERVLLIGPSHYHRFDGAVLPGADAYRTPLGDVPIDTDAVRDLGELPGFRLDDAPFAPEHSLESELPFLQRVLPSDFRVIPVLTGGAASPESIESVSADLAGIVGPDTLVIASSDFTHYGERFDYVPFKGHVEVRVRELDMRAVEHIVDRDREAFHAFTTRTHATICGRDAIRVLLALLPDEARGRMTVYDTSGRQTGDWDNTVSYAGIVFDGPARREGVA